MTPPSPHFTHLRTRADTYPDRALNIPVALLHRHPAVERLAQRRVCEHVALRSISDNPAAPQQNHAPDLWNDLFDMMRDQNQCRAVSWRCPHAFHEAMSRDDIESGRRLVEHERARVR